MSYSGSAGGGIGGVSPASTPLVAAVPGTKILLCKSGVKDKKPDPLAADYGEVFVNYHSGSPMLCFKDNAGEIVEIKPTRNIDSGGGETPPSTGNEIGDTLWDGTHFRVWDGSTWVAVGPNDLAYVQKVDGGTITNSAGSDVDIPVVNNIQAGLMLPADKNKLDTYPANSADLEVDLGYTAAADKGTVTNSNGDDAEIPLATGTNAGLMAPGDKNKIDGYPATPDDLAATLDLQAVTDNGNTTTNGAKFGGNVKSGSVDITSETASGATLDFRGNILIQRPDGATSSDIYFSGYSGTERTVRINGDGTARFDSKSSSVYPGTGSTLPSSAFTIRNPDQLTTETYSLMSFGASGNNGNNTYWYAGNGGTTNSFTSSRFVLGARTGSSGYTERLRISAQGKYEVNGDIEVGGDPQEGATAGLKLWSSGQIDAARTSGTQALFKGYTVGNNTPTTRIDANGTAFFAGEVTADTFKYSGSAPSPALAGKEIDLVATLHLMAAKLAELGDVDVASLFVANDPAPVTQPADPADDAGA